MKQHADKLKAKVAELQAAVTEWNAIRAFAESDGFKAYARSVETRILASVNALCQEDCTETQATKLRAEIHALRWFLQIPKVRLDEMQKLAKDIEHLRPTVDRLQRVGLSANDPALKKAAEDVADAQKLLQDIRT